MGKEIHRRQYPTIGRDRFAAHDQHRAPAHPQQPPGGGSEQQAKQWALAARADNYKAGARLGGIVGDLVMRAADAPRHADADAIAFAHYPRGGFGLLAKGCRDGCAIGGTDILPGVQYERRGHMQEMQFRALLAGGERRSQHGAVRIAGKISGGDDGGHGWHDQ